MALEKTILWYDLETYGLSPRVDRIAQVAMIRTDLSLEIVSDPILLYGRLSPDYLPSPESCLVTGLTPIDINEKKESLSEYDLIKRVNDEFLVPGTIGVGYNNIGFDDECIRSTLYRNLFDPYERENFKMRSRWDIINLVRATRDLRPEGMVFEKKNPDTGFVSFRLTDLTEENNIEQEGAHDALVDVYATINVAKLIRQKQPALFDFYFSHRSKRSLNSMLDTLRGTPVMYTCQFFTNEHGSSRPVCPISLDRSRANTVVCFDLTKDARTLLDAEDVWNGLVRITTNRCPFIAPITILSKVEEVQRRLAIDMELMQSNLDFIHHNRAAILERLEPLMETKSQTDANLDPDLRIYADSFYSDNDRANMKLINSFPPQRRLRAGLHFDSEKVPKLLFRQVARNWPEVLGENERLLWKNYCATRLIQPFGRNPGYNAYMREIADGLESMGTDARSKLTLVALREYGQQLYSQVMG